MAVYRRDKVLWRALHGRAQGAPCIHTLARTRVHAFKHKLWICTTYTHADPHIKRKTVYAMEDTASTHYKTNCGSGARTQGAYNMTEVVGLSYTWCVLHRWVGNGRGWTQCLKCTRTRRKAGEAPAVHQVPGSPWVRPSADSSPTRAKSTKAGKMWMWLGPFPLSYRRA